MEVSGQLHASAALIKLDIFLKPVLGMGQPELFYEQNKQLTF
jgi:hypothetical protein